MSKDKNKVKVNTSKVKMMYKKSQNNAMKKFKQMSLVQNYFFRSNEV